MQNRPSNCSSVSDPPSQSKRRTSVPQAQQAGPARPAAKRQDSSKNTAKEQKAPLKRQDTASNDMARLGLCKDSTSSQNSTKGTQPGSKNPSGAPQRKGSGLERAKQALGPSTSASVEEQIFDLKKAGSIGFISAMCGNKVTILSYDGPKGAQVPAKDLLAGSKLQVGLQVCKGADVHFKTRIFTPVVPSEEYQGIIVAHAPTFTGEIGVVTVRPPSPGQPISLSSDSCEGGTKLSIGRHVYQRTVSCKYFTRAIGPE